MQHGPWTAQRLLSRLLAVVERFLSQAGFEQGPWVAVAFATGIIAWFVLPSATWWAGLCASLVVVFAIARAWFPRLNAYPHIARALVVVPLLVGAGCLVIWTRSELVGEPAIERPISGVFRGRVLSVEPQPALERDRLTVAMHEPGGGRTIKVRVNVPGAGAAAAIHGGDVVEFRARLMPPAPPMLPGAYDFARTAWFNGIAATGSAIGEVRIIEGHGADEGGLSGLRRGLTAHIQTRIGLEAGGIAAAFVTGDRGGISKTDAAAMRDSGLAHLLSISGLHVSAMVGAVYVVVVRLLALFPWVALRFRLPVIAAGAGALAGVAYTLLSGSEVPTVRSCIGSLLVLAALALGREPLSLRMLATAAFCVMLLWPEAVMGPSFQMSFGAVLALVAISTAEPVRRFLGPRDESLGARALRHVGMLLVTGAVIDLALMPIGLYHFHRAGVYGALANVLAIPLSTFIVMPLLALALTFDIVGLGAPFWWLAGLSIDLLTDLAHWFASRPGAVKVLPGTGAGAFLLFVAGGLWLGLWTGRIRWLGLIAATTGAALLAMAPPADVLISGDGRHVGIVENGGEKLFLLRDGGEGYARDNLIELAGMDGAPTSIEKWPGARCNHDFCMLTVTRDNNAWRLLISRGRDAVPERGLAASCERSDIVISDRWLPRSCHPRWLKADRDSLGRTGGLALYLSSHRIVTVTETQGEHDWRRDPPSRNRRPFTSTNPSSVNEPRTNTIVDKTP